MNKKIDAQKAKEEAVGILNFWLGLREKDLVMAKAKLKSISQKIMDTVGKRNLTEKLLKQIRLSIWCHALVIYANAKIRTVTKIESKVKAIKTALTGLEQPSPDPDPAIKFLSESIHYSSKLLADLISGLRDLDERTG